MGDFIKVPNWLKKDSNLTYKQRLFYAEILNFHLCGPRGCVAPNKWFAGQYNLTEVGASAVCKQLEQKGYVKRKTITKQGKNVGRKMTPLILGDKEHCQNDKGCQNNDCQNVSLALSKRQPIRQVLDNREEETKKPMGEDKTSPKDSPQNNPQDSFEKFWQAYPKKVVRIAALKAWQKLSPDQRLFDEIMAALEKHTAQDSWHKENGKYIPKPSNWLSDERWADELSSPQASVDFDDMPWDPTHPTHPTAGLPTEDQVNEILREAANDN